MPQRHHGRQHNSRQLASGAHPEPLQPPPPAHPAQPQQQPLFQQPSQLPQPPSSIRNPWAGAADSDHGTSSSASIPPPRPAAANRHVRSSSNSLASSSRAASRNIGAPGCCSPGAQLVCHYCLRAALLCCLLSGSALAVAGAVLQRHEHEDLGVLLYIGVLAALVSLVLLLVQWQSHRPPPHRLRPVRPAQQQGLQLEEAVPLQDMRHQQQVHIVPQHPLHPGIMSGQHPWQLPPAGINPYQFQHGLTIPQQSARSEDMLSVVGGESSRMAGRVNRPASIAMVPVARPPENMQWWRANQSQQHQQPRPAPPTLRPKPIYHMNQPP